MWKIGQITSLLSTRQPTEKNPTELHRNHHTSDFWVLRNWKNKEHFISKGNKQWSHLLKDVSTMQEWEALSS